MHAHVHVHTHTHTCTHMHTHTHTCTHTHTHAHTCTHTHIYISFCKYSPSQYYDLAKRYIGPVVTEKALRATVFGQFVGGINEREAKRTVRRLADAGVSSIWNYSTEKDLQ